MSTQYRVTLVQLKPGATALGASGDKLELGLISSEEIIRLAANLLKVDFSANPKAEPGIIVQRDDKGWRIAVHQGRLRMHKSTSLYDEYWVTDNAAGLALLPPFSVEAAATPTRAARKHAVSAPKSTTLLRSVAEVGGLFVLAFALIVVGFHFGLPQRRLSDLPPEILLVTADSERAQVFSAVAGSYVTGKKPGDSIVTITSEGRVSFARIGKDGKPTAPLLEEQARAARKGNLAVVLTSRGNIAELPPDAVNVGSYPWRKLMTN